MRRITFWMLATVTVLVLLFSYRTSTSSRSPVVAAGPLAGGSGAIAGSSGDSAASGSTGVTDGSGSGGSSGTSGSAPAGTAFTGDAAMTRYGPVQVKITVASGKITAATVTQVPWQDHRDQEINSQAVPILTDETLTAQSASIDMVSGATFTSQGYLQSLQSAIDQAKL